MADGGQPSPQLNRDGAGPYTIVVSGEVARHWEPELRMQLRYATTPWGTMTTLSGQLPDQAALYGVLGQLAMWGYLVLLVRYDLGREHWGAVAEGEST